MVRKIFDIIDFEVDLIENFSNMDLKSNSYNVVLCQIPNELNLHKNLQKIQKICSEFNSSDVRLIIFPPQIFSLPSFKERYSLINLLETLREVVQDVPIIINPFGKDIFLISSKKITKLASTLNFKNRVYCVSLDKIMGCNIDLCIESIPFYLDNFENKYNQFVAHCSISRRSMIYLNKVGAEEELVFDGHSCIIGANGNLLHQMPGWESSISAVKIHKKDSAITLIEGDLPTSLSLPILDNKSLYSCLVMGTKDYFSKNNLTKAVIGLSGGIDSSLVAAIAVDALGSENVTGIYLPSKFSSELSGNLSRSLAEKLGINYLEYPIDPIVDSIHQVFLPNDLCQRNVKHNIQARARGILLMSYANQNNYVVLATSNKTEIALGYNTLYGDTCGGFAPLKNVYKNQIYELVHWRNDNLLSFGLNENLEIFSDELIYRKPTSELEDNCLDSDDLADYDTLDTILGYLFHGKILPDKWVNSSLVQQITNIVLQNRFKRFQLPVGPSLYSKESKHYPVGSYTEK